MHHGISWVDIKRCWVGYVQLCVVDFVLIGPSVCVVVMLISLSSGRQNNFRNMDMVDMVCTYRSVYCWIRYLTYLPHISALLLLHIIYPIMVPTSNSFSPTLSPPPKKNHPRYLAIQKVFRGEGGYALYHTSLYQHKRTICSTLVFLTRSNYHGLAF